MNLKAFLVDALGQALDLGIGTPDDVVRHVTPDVLAQYLPRPLWARLLTACLGASRVDATLVVETVGVPNLCEHVPTHILWTCIAEIATRALGRTAGEILAPRGDVIVSRSDVRADAVPSAARGAGFDPSSRGVPLAPPPPEVIVPAAPAPAVAMGPSIPSPVNAPLADLIDELDRDERPIARTRPPASQRFRPAPTGLGRLGASAGTRRPQAIASPTPTTAVGSRPRRVATEVTEPEMESEQPTKSGDALAVDDSQLVDWQANDETEAGGEDFTDFTRNKR